MDLSAILSVGALPSTEMDRIGVSGNQDQNTALSEGFGFEQNLAALLGGALITQPNQISIDSKSENFAQNLSKQIELNLVDLKDGGANSELALQSQMIDPENAAQNLSQDAFQVKNLNLLNSVAAFKALNTKTQGLNQSVVSVDSVSMASLQEKLNPTDFKDLKMVSGQNPVSVDDSPIENLNIKSSINGSVNNALEKSPQSGLMDPMKSLASLRAENRESLMDENVEAGGFDRLQSLSSESALKSSLKNDLGEALQLKASVKNEIKLAKPLNIKNLADSLFIQGQIGSDSIFQKAAMSTENLTAENFEAQVQTNLVQDMEAFISQVIETNEGGSISLKLRPGNLGEVQVKVDVQADSVRIQMDTQSQFTESVLKSQSHELKQQLQSLGLKIDELQISSKASSEQFHDSKDQKNSHNPFSQQEQRKDQQDSKRQFSMEENATLNFEEA